MAVEAARLKAIVTADTSDGERKIRGFVEKQAGVIEKGFSGIGAAMGLAATAMAVQSVARYGVEAAKMATANAAVESSFRDLASTAGQSSDEILDALKNASDGAISEYDLMLSANRAMMLGVADTADEMAGLLDIARRRGQAMGLSTTQAFNDIVTGLGRGSALILDNLGIVIDLEQTYEQYAATLGKTASELTDIEKKQATVNRVMSEVSGIGGTPISDPWEKYNAAMVDLKTTIGDVIAQPLGSWLEGAAGGARAAQAGIEGMQAAFAGEEGPTAAQQIVTLASQQAAAFDVLASATDEQIDQAFDLIDKMQDLRDTMVDPTASAMAIDQARAMAGAEVAAIADAFLAEKTIRGELVEANRQSAAETQAAWNAYRASEITSWNAYAVAVEAENQRIASEARQSAIALALTVDELANSLAWGGVDDLFGDMGGEALEYLHELRRVASDTYQHWLAETNNAAFAQERARDAVAEVVAELGAVAPAYDSATQAMIDGANTVAGIVDNVSARLYSVIGAQAFDNASEYERVLSEVYQGFIDDGYTAEQATLATRDAANELVDSVSQLHGGGLDDVSDAAWRAESQIWGTVAAAQALMDLLGASQGTVDSMFTGAVGRGLTGAGAATMAEAVNAEREALIADMAQMGVGARDAAFALAEFDAQTQATISGITSAYSESQRETRKSTASTASAGRAAKDLSDGLGDLSGMLKKIPGLFDPSAVTQEQLDGAAAGLPQNFADDYLRQLRDEVQNGVDWEGVDIGDAALALGMDPNAAAEQVLAAFEAAWADSSLFANPENMNFLNMDAIQAELDRQMQSAQGEKNLQALLGIGDAEDVSAIASLGLEVQNGLAGWLEENGMEDAGARIAEALATGLQTDDMGEAAAGGMESFVNSGAGQEAFYGIGYDAGGSVSQGITDRILDDLIKNRPPATGGGGGTSTEGTDGNPARSQSTGGVHFTQTVVVRHPHEQRLQAQYTAQEMRRRSR